MRCLHHLRAASGEWLNIHVGLVATTPLFEEETYRKVSSSLAPMQYTGVCRIAQLPNRGWLLGFGREVFFPRHKCSVERTENLMGASAFDYIYLYILLLCSMTIYLYLYSNCILYLFLYCMLAAWEYYFLYIYILFLFLTSTSIFL